MLKLYSVERKTEDTKALGLNDYCFNSSTIKSFSFSVDNQEDEIEYVYILGTYCFKECKNLEKISLPQNILKVRLLFF